MSDEPDIFRSASVFLATPDLHKGAPAEHLEVIAFARRIPKAIGMVVAAGHSMEEAHEWLLNDELGGKYSWDTVRWWQEAAEVAASLPKPIREEFPLTQLGEIGRIPERDGERARFAMQLIAEGKTSVRAVRVAAKAHKAQHERRGGRLDKGRGRDGANQVGGDQTPEETTEQSLLVKGGDELKSAAVTAPAGEETRASSSPPATVLVISVMQEVAAWAVLERNATKLGEVWKLADEAETVPESIQVLWTRLEDVDLKAVADQSLVECNLDALSMALHAELTGHLWRVYEARILSDNPPTLEELGLELGVTRERVRQIQRAAQERVDALLNRREWTPIHWRAALLGSILGPIAPLDAPEVQRAVAWSLRGSEGETVAVLRPLILRLAGPYVERDGWFVRGDAHNPSVANLASRANEYGLLTADEVSDWLDTAGIRGAFHDEWVERNSRLRRLGEFVAVWSGNVVDKAVALLAASGEPADAETLVDQIGEGHSVRGVRGRFFEDKRLIRVSRNDWALSAWGLEEYTGVVDEMVQRINDWGGRAELDELIRELVPLFKIKESSVRVYAEAPMFVLEDGWVRLRRDDEPFEVSDDISRCRGAYRSGQEVLSYLITVDRDMLRGSGRALPAAVAGALAVRPGVHRTFDYDRGSLVVTWPFTSAVGPSLGSTRALAEGVSAQLGDFLRLTFSSSSSTVAAARIEPAKLAASESSHALSLLTGIDFEGIDPHPVLAEAIGVRLDEVGRVLADRRDPAARLLPEMELDHGLQGALGELADVLDHLG